MENTKTREPQQKRSIEKKNKIIEVGFRLMCENGYQKTTTADIAKAAGVSTGIIYSYFTDKHDIFTAGLELFGSQMIVPMYDQFTFPLDIRKSVNIVIDALIDGHQIFRNAHKEIESLVMTDEDIARIIYEFEMRTTKDLEIFLLKAGFTPENLLEKTHIIYNMIESLCHELTFHKHEELDCERMRAIVVDTILGILGEPESAREGTIST
ncbi:MAG: TetR/AcrR family transcriptional regulator [Lachnospiraceae bacterium]|nr:TetR/AcrR family transcriptional regulator [Lachnospiraceae bacterium]MDE7274743.1 TetR/AcrR family transcriptional regulator [Lachnospiraceae bacterium]